LLTGDTMPSWQLPAALVKLVESVGVPVYFVLGNHDYYGWSIAETKTAVDQAVYAVKKSKRALIWLDRQDGPIPLDTRTTLAGTGGWGDFIAQLEA
jgi:Icc protein